MSQPGAAVRLTVVIPTKDRPDLLPLAVSSALRALPPDGAEVLVVDDGSHPPAGDCLAALAEPRLRLIENHGPHGPGNARNFGVSSARGDLILFLDDDDLLLTGYPAAVMRAAEGPSAPDYGFCAIVTFVSGNQPDPLPGFAASGSAEVSRLSPRRRLAGLGCGFWIRRDLFAKAGGIDSQLLVNEDTDFSLRLLALGARGVRFDTAGVLVRQHDRSVALAAHQTHRHGPARRAEWFGLILSRHAAYLAAHPDLRRHLLQRRLSMFAKAGLTREARSLLSGAEAKGARLRLGLHYLACRLGRLRVR